MIDILTLLTGKKKASPSGWTSFNAVCCHHRGHKQDKRMRGGIRFTESGDWVYHCFNCQFKCSIKTGFHFSQNLKQLLSWCGMDREEIDRHSFESFQQRTVMDVKTKAFAKPFIVNFDDVPLPLGAMPLDINDPDHQRDIQYIRDRGLDPFEYPYHVTPDEQGRNRERIIIPYYYKGRIVGYISRFYYGRIPKYISEQQLGYVFNIDNQEQDWQACILVEGQFDALSIGGCAYMGSNISNEQAQLLSRLHRTIIVVPDRDKAGLEICDRAIDLGYRVSIPPWHSDVKDVNDAVKRYGRLATTLSILQHSTTSKIKIEMNRRKFK
jgi:hypothetical protein